jgi:DNA-binding NarL/FixJ family response regulator
VVSNVRLFQDGVSSALGRQGRIRVVGTSDIPHAVERIAQLHPDIVLFEARRPDSLDHAKALTAAQPAAKVVAFGVPENDHEILALAATGIAGYVREDAAAEDAIAVLAGVMRDELLCSPRTAASLYHQVALLSQNGGDSPGPTLSPREFQIAHLIERGLSNKQIARQLKIEATTVKNHVHNILDKLNVHRRGEAAARIRAELKLRHPADAQALAPSATNNG